eukprot:2415968-Prymnesium_polylepis.1
MEASRSRLLAAGRAVGDAEEADDCKKIELKEARIELKEHDDPTSACGRLNMSVSRETQQR